MTMKKFYLLVLMAMAAISCQREAEVIEPVPSPNEDVTEEMSSSPYAISEEEALERLDAELKVLYGESTRANERRVSKISAISYNRLYPNTRVSNANIADLLYIVEFADNNGSAILGADERVEDVFAVLDSDVISVEDFENAASGVDDGDIKIYLAGLMLDEAVNQLTRDSFELRDPIISDLRYSYYEYDTLKNENRTCYLRTKWNQYSPYNNFCYDDDWNKCPAGCVTIAVAQTILHTNPQNSDYITLNGEEFSVELLNWKRINEQIPADKVEIVNYEVARYVSKLAQMLEITFRPGGSEGNYHELETILTDLGCYDAELTYVDDSDFEGNIRDQLYVRGLPLPFAGKDNSTGSGHAWVLDAYVHNVVDVFLVTVEGNAIVRKEYFGRQETRKVHCNFGWAGSCDGYYSFAIFDLSTALPDADTVGEINDISSAMTYNRYHDNMHGVFYSL